MPIVVCPHCQTRLEAPSGVLGRQVVCGQCSQRFTAAEEAPPPAEQVTAAGPPASQPPTAPWPGPPPGLFAQPYRAYPKSSGKATAALVLGICSVAVCWCYGVPSVICGILAVIFAGSACRDIAEGLMDPAAESKAKAGRICGIIGLVFAVGMVVFMVVALTLGGGGFRYRYGF